MTNFKGDDYYEFLTVNRPSNTVDITITKCEVQNGQIVLNPDYEEQQRKANRKIEILRRLDEIDRICIRAIRANETERIATYEAECEQLRAELRELS